jgi:hypothetical protein
MGRLLTKDDPMRGIVNRNVGKKASTSGCNATRSRTRINLEVNKSGLICQCFLDIWCLIRMFTDVTLSKITDLFNTRRRWRWRRRCNWCSPLSFFPFSVSSLYACVVCVSLSRSYVCAFVCLYFFLLCCFAWFHIQTSAMCIISCTSMCDATLQKFLKILPLPSPFSVRDRLCNPQCSTPASPFLDIPQLITMIEYNIAGS